MKINLKAAANPKPARCFLGLGLDWVWACAPSVWAWTGLRSVGLGLRSGLGLDWPALRRFGPALRRLLFVGLGWAGLVAALSLGSVGLGLALESAIFFGSAGHRCQDFDTTRKMQKVRKSTKKSV